MGFIPKESPWLCAYVVGDVPGCLLVKPQEKGELLHGAATGLVLTPLLGVALLRAVPCPKARGAKERFCYLLNP